MLYRYQYIHNLTTIPEQTNMSIFVSFFLLYRPDEAELFAKSAQNAYKQFRDKAALSRSMTVCSKFIKLIVPVNFCSSLFLIDLCHITTSILYLRLIRWRR